MSEKYGMYHPGVCEYPGCDQPYAKHGFQNGRQRYKRYCSHHYGKLHDRTRAERRKRNPHRLTYEERRKTKLRKHACERCGWNEARCDLHRIIPGGPYNEENTITLCPNCHRVETERVRLQDGFGGRGLLHPHRRSFVLAAFIISSCAFSHFFSPPSRS